LKNTTVPFRLCYSQTTVRANTLPLESTQSGVELIGAKGISADTEILVLAAKSLSETDSSFRIELGYGLLFSTLVDEYGLTADVAEEAKEHIERKNFAALEAMDIPEAIKKLPRYFGGVEVLDAYAKLVPSERVVAMLEYLRKLYFKLSECGFADHIDFDLGIVNSLDYYTGIIFRGYITDSGSPVLSGGRYDNLLEKYGTAFPAIGFGINIDSVFDAKKDGATADSVPQILVNAAPECEAKAFAEAESLTEQGISFMFSYATTADIALEEAKVRGISKVVRITADGRKEYDV
jgi:ATP phosphoribosyltransferase regulatory subunit